MTTTNNDEDNIVSRCRKYNACVVYLIQETDDNEIDINRILSTQSGVNRRSGLSVGSAIVHMDQLYDVTLPRNTIATITVSEEEAVSSMMYPDMFNYNLATLSQQTEDEMTALMSVSQGMVRILERLSWSKVVMIMFNTGVTELVTNNVVVSGEVCVEQVIHLNLNYLQSPAYQFLLTMMRSRESLHMVLVSQTVEQVSELLMNMSTDLGWDTVTSVGHYLSWSYLQTPEHLAVLAEELPSMSMFIMSESGDSVDTSAGPVGLASAVMETLGQSLSSYSSRHCPDSSSLLTCVTRFRSYLSTHGPETVTSIGAMAYNLLRLNNVGGESVFDDEEPLYVLSGEWDGARVIMYEDIGQLRSQDTSPGHCINSTGDYTAQLVTMLVTDSNIQTLWGSIALGICIFGVLIVIISAFYFIIAVNRKQKAEFGSGKDHTRLLHYMIIIGLVILFLSPVPWIIPVNIYTCIARQVAPTLAFSIVLAR